MTNFIKVYMKVLFYTITMLILVLSGCSREFDEPLLIAYNDGSSIYLIDENGENLKQLPTGGSDQNPAFSPDGKNIVYWRTGTYYTKNLEIGQQVPLIGGVGMYSTWSPDGSKIAYLASNHLLTINADGTDPVQISAANVNNGPVTWSSDSQIIACRRGGDFKILYYDLNNPPLSTFLPEGLNPVDVFGVSFSPDGKEIVYTDLSTNMYVSSIDFTSVRVLNVQGINPSWSPDGSKIVYENGGYIRIVSSDGGDYIEIAGPNCHNPCYQYKPH